MASQMLAEALRFLRSAACEQADDRGDAELLRRFAGRDEGAFATLLQRHGPLVLGTCRQVLHDEQDCEDAFQATFLVLARKASSIRRGESLAAWLHRVALNVARSARAGTACRRSHERRAARLAQPRPAADEPPADWQPIVHEEVGRLPPKYRLPIVLCYLEGKTHSEAAAELGWPLGTVKGRLARARDLLRARLARRGLALAAPGLAVAAVPAALLAATRRSVPALARGTAAGPGSARALALADEALRTAGPARLSLVGLFCLLAVAAGGALFALRSPEAGRAAVPPKAAAERPRTDLHGDPLPPGALARLGTVRFRHGQALWAVAFSPDGKTVASAGAGGSLVVHDTSTGKTLHSFRREETDPTYPHAVAFSPDGKTLAAVVSRPVRFVGVWDVATGKRARQFPLTGKPIYSLSFSKDGGTLAAGSQHLIQVWDVRTGKEVVRIPRPPGTWFQSQGVALAPDGKTLATAVTHKKEIVFLYLWDTVSGRQLRRWQAHPREAEVHALTYSPDGKYLACAGGYADDNGWLGVWSASTGERQVEAAGKFRSLRYSRCGKLLAAGGTGSVSLLAADTGKVLRHVPTGWVPTGPMDFRPDGKVLALGALWSVTLWDVTTGKRLGPALDGHERVVDGVMFLPDGKTVASTSEGAVNFWQARTGTRIRRFVGAEANHNHRALSPDGKIRAVRQWHSSPVGAGGRETIELWDTQTGKKLREVMPPPTSTPKDVVFSPDGKRLAAAAWDNTTQVWDATTGKLFHQFPEREPTALSLALSPDGKTLAVGDGALEHPRAPRVRLFDLGTGRELRKPFELPGPGPREARRVVWVGGISFSADGKVLAAAAYLTGGPSSEHTILVYEMETGQALCRIQGAPVPTRGSEQNCRLALSPDGKSLITPGLTPLLWEVATGKVRARIKGHAAWVGAVAFSPDGRLLATGSRDTTALVWDALNLNGDPPAAVQLSRRELEALWADLAGEDAGRAYRAIRALVAAPTHSVPFLRQELRPAPAAAPKHLARLIADLGADEFAVRERATGELEKLGPQAIPALKRALAGRPSLEARRRIEALLRRPDHLPRAADELRAWRAVEVLEHIGTAEARGVLEKLAEGPELSRLTQGARAARARLARAPKGP
jgi:RNA polymerase sigma factor (sigma-70 family)